MKRSQLSRAIPLKRTPFKHRPKPHPVPQADYPDYAIWKSPVYGRCQNCGLIDVYPLHKHHVVSRQKLRHMGAPEWTLANAMLLCQRCHMNHEFGQVNRKIPVDRLPAAAVTFAADLLGEELADDYLRKHYGPPVGR